ncbi:hypothetical protein [Candidatus Thalassarchaeum betae]|uniref:hypothetical protein n=1 Tax=Candidatus Thalassarchaeum betae TaxID=2599289 RepID=UPI0030C67F59|nr:hypothetical protein [Candidatus Thalassoarchaea betae]
MKPESWLMVGAAVMTAAFFAVVVFSPNALVDEDWEIVDVCLAGHNELVSHEHATLRIFLDGSEVAIAAEIGIDDASCDGLRGIHTHDGTGKLHIETPRTMEAPVGAFFDIWGETFNENQILNSVADEDSEVVMYVNGELNDEYGSYAMKNNDVIEIHYRDKSD